MTSVPRSSPKKNDTRTYTKWEWAKAYTALVLVWPFFAVAWVVSKLLPKLPERITAWLARKVHAHMATHPMSFRIPPDTSVPAYMSRWWYLPRNAFFNVYLHIVQRSDDDRALHCHPWMNLSIVLEGGYTEHTILPGGIHKREWFGPGSLKVRMTGKFAHRLELARRHDMKTKTVSENMAVTIFITGPVLRRWGFHDGARGWIDAYDWDAHCEEHGIKAMRMDGGSDGVVSERNRL